VFVHAGQMVALDAPGHDDIANIGFIVGDRCVAVIDSGGSVRIGRALREAIKQRTSLPICYVVNTHDHVDHVLGDIAFKSDHAHFVGSATLPTALARSRDFFAKNYAADFDAPASGDAIVTPDETVAATRDIDLGHRILALRAWPKAHTDCDLTVYDATSGTLWTGDLVFVDRVPALDGSVKGWLAALDVLGTMHPAHVVPGHGPVGTDLTQMLAPERRYLTALVDGVRAALAKGQSLDDATRTVGRQEKPHWQLFDTAHPRNVSRVYQELEWE
jgi:quinoprotein relay system zinc metallohydrolase 2